ncbi:MAG: Histone deacetylase-like amidohydrolase [Alphaproteobacteria bacterium MarineAlpha9_Bin7]|nr:MAG: Histone deacetylase-like amidohydrolase [Alphaproteobacteria bacterium MarineAlpha9_Bin7]
MTTLIYTHKACMNHDTGDNHPERAERLRAVLDALAMPSLSVLDHREAPLATLSQLTRVHRRTYIDQALSTVPSSGHAYLDPDTVISPRSGEAARRAAGAVCGAVDAVMHGDATRAFCAVRPPGHHADSDHAMGFCIFNNVAVGAAHALVQYDIRRVAIVDFDVHHGNGTQNIFSREPRILLTGSHQMPLYPGSGAASEVGIGNIVNMPLTPNSGRKEFEAQWRTHGLARLATFEPQLIFISAGFDGHRDDPLAQLELAGVDYAWLTNEIVKIAEQSAAGRVISTLEGGYQLDALADSCVAHVKALM